MGTHVASTDPRSGGWRPESRSGRWSAAFAGLAAGGVAAVVVAFALGVEPADGFRDNWLLTGTGTAILSCAGAAVGTGTQALVRRHDRSWAVLSAVTVGVVLLALMLQQVAEGLGWLSA
jgi:hypothetical protein